MATISPEIAAQAAKIDRDSVGEKVRVHTVAKQLGIRATDFLGVLADHGIEGKKTASSLTQAQVFSVLDALSASSEPSQADEKPAEVEAPAAEKPKKSAKKAAKKATKKSAKQTAKKRTKKSSEPAEHAKPSKSVEPAEQKEQVEQAVEDATEVAPEAVAEETTEKPEKKSAKRTAKRSVKKTAKRAVKKSAKKSQQAEEPEQKPEKKSERAAAQVAKPQEEKAQEEKAQEEDSEQKPVRRRRVRRVVRRVGSARRAEERASEEKADETPAKNVAPEDLHPAERATEDLVDEPVKMKGSTRLESQRRWRAKNRDKNYKAITRAEFLARRESVERTMIVRDSERTDRKGMMTQVGVVEDGQLVEHFVADATHQSLIGNVYLGRVQNVLGSMEAAFVDIGTGRNAVLYAGEMDWRSPHLHSKSRKIDQALRPGDQILVQVLKDPIGHKGARLTNRISFAGRYLVYFPAGTTAGISRKLPAGERKRLKDILGEVITGDGGAIIRTAAENATEEQITEDVQRLEKRWQEIQKLENKERNSKGSKPVTLYEEPNMLIQVVRDVFNADFSELIIDGDKSWQAVRDYLGRTSPELMDRVHKWNRGKHDGQDAFAPLDLDQQLEKAMARKVWLPSGGYLIIDHTEAMTVIDVNTGSFVGSGGNLEATVTENNLEAAEEIVRQLRLRDIGGMIVVDFIDMLLQQNQDLVLRRLSEFLGRDRTRHKLGEVTSLGLVQLTRKRLGTGLLETFSTPCEACDGRGFIMHPDPVEQKDPEPRRDHGHRKERQQAKNQGKNQSKGQLKERGQGKAPERSQREDKQVERTPQTEQTEQTQRPQSPQGTRRRVRRVVRRGTPLAAQGSERQEEQPEPKQEQSQKRGGNAKARNRASDIEGIVASARKRSAQEDPDEPSAADNAERPEQNKVAANRVRRRRRVVRSAHTNARSARSSSGRDAHSSAANQSSYEEAKRKFEESPRRKRQTRGNSKSDFAPRPEDFGVTNNNAEKGGEKPRSRGRRRRVVRKTN
ncbi:Rne/Rng family ribonuclease [Corynebacterium jeikeium]|uniref:Rne/Rng family ribonuclease n=1 Tax=Corynebacterium jeikeium TaxID=38289 RepID=UPI0002F70F78|nr:Rne/Rng family ribonuclease [Corynebacterium jeikeium]OOD33715.1 ribonuclease E [Corynebacterium jeikeium]WCZ53109.1 Ribonuclease G [Corynebacterium jeikeium]SUY81583.1 ribonuclease E [Corynebacterium jeikeium]